MTDDLVQRLRGIYTVPVNDGCGPLNGSMEYTRTFDVPPIHKEAADAIERKDAEIAELRARIADAPTAEVTLGCYLDADQLPPEFALRRVALVVKDEKELDSGRR